MFNVHTIHNTHTHPKIREKKTSFSSKYCSVFIAYFECFSGCRKSGCLILHNFFYLLPVCLCIFLSLSFCCAFFGLLLLISDSSSFFFLFFCHIFFCARSNGSFLSLSVERVCTSLIQRLNKSQFTTQTCSSTCRIKICDGHIKFMNNFQI